MNKKVCYGLDLGTTNTVVARGVMGINGFLNTEIIQIVQYDEFKNINESNILPSVMFLDENDEEFVGIIGKNFRSQAHKKTISNSKRYMGTSNKMEIGNKKYLAKDVARIILETCKKSMDRYGMEEDDSVTITVPASFNSDQIKDTKDAAIEAGFKNIKIIPEPTASLIDFINDQTSRIEEQRTIDFSKKKRILVFDLGGGTCDVDIVDVFQEKNNVEFTEVAIGRYDELGGIDFDIKAAEFVLDNYCKENKICFSGIDEEIKEKMKNSIRIFCEKAKESISAQLYFGDNDNPLYRQYINNFFKGQGLNFSINRETYDKATQSLYEKAKSITSYEDLKSKKNIVDPILNVLKEKKISKNSIDLVFLTGGMTKYPTIKEKIKEIMELNEDKIICSPYPLEAVARGAAIYQYYNTKIKELKHNEFNDSDNFLQENDKNSMNKSFKVKPVMSEAIMIDIMEGLPVTIVEAGQMVPCSGEVKGRLRTTSPAGVTISLYAGKDEFDWKMNLQRNYKATFNKPIKVNTPIDIEYTIDEFKELTIEVKVEDEKIVLHQEIDDKIQ